MRLAFIFSEINLNVDFSISQFQYRARFQYCLRIELLIIKLHNISRKLILIPHAAASINANFERIIESFKIIIFLTISRVGEAREVEEVETLTQLIAKLLANEICRGLFRRKLFLPSLLFLPPFDSWRMN